MAGPTGLIYNAISVAFSICKMVKERFFFGISISVPKKKWKETTKMHNEKAIIVDVIN